MRAHMECKLEEKDLMNAIGNPFIYFFRFKDSSTKSLACEKIVRADVGEYSQIRAKVLLMQSTKKNKKLSNCFATRSFNLALAS